MTDSNEPSDQEDKLRQLGLLALASSKGGLDDLSALLMKMKSVLSSLEAISADAWIAEARRDWGKLEILYALALEDGRVALTHEEESDVVAIVNVLTERSKRHVGRLPVHPRARFTGSHIKVRRRIRRRTRTAIRTRASWRSLFHSPSKTPSTTPSGA